MPEEKADRIDIITKVCFGPLETEIWGVKDGQFFVEFHFIEGLQEGEIDFHYVSAPKFLQALDFEIKLIMAQNCQELTDILNEYRTQYFG